MTRKVKEARRDPRINAQIKRALKSWAARQPQSARTLQINDGKPPADGNTFAVTVNLSLTTLDEQLEHNVYNVHVDHNLYNDHIDHDGCDAHDDRDVRGGHDSRDVREGHDDRDDDVITIDSRAEPAGLLTVLAVEDTNQTELLNRWIVDPRSNTHVINTEAWQGWKRTIDNPERCSVNVGNSRILITAWGTMKLTARTLYRSQTLELTRRVRRRIPHKPLRPRSLPYRVNPLRLWPRRPVHASDIKHYRAT
jgi:hypothetical protein